MRVALFATCFNDTLFPSTVEATAVLLERLGCTVELPLGQACCGQMHVNSGYPDLAIPMVRNFVDVFSEYDHVVSPSASCVGSVRDQHDIVAHRSGDTKLAAAVESMRPTVKDLSEFLVDVLGVTDVGATFPHRVAYHPTCHSLRVLRLGERPLQLLRSVQGLELVELANSTSCCGFGGTFSVKNSDVSSAMMSDKLDALAATDAEWLVSADNSCLMHLGGGLNRRGSKVKVAHLAEILAGTVA